VLFRDDESRLRTDHAPANFRERHEVVRGEPTASLDKHEQHRDRRKTEQNIKALNPVKNSVLMSSA